MKINGGDIMRNNAALQNEVNLLCSVVSSNFGQESKQYRDCIYYLDILKSYYIYSYEDFIGRDILNQFKSLLEAMCNKLPDLQFEKLNEKYPNIVQMVKTLDFELPIDY